MTASGSLRPMGLLTKALALAAATLGFAVADAQASVISMRNVSITMSDGTVLHANVFLPTTPGTYPTLLTVTGYNKDSENPTGTECDGHQGIVEDDPTFAEKGYAVMVLDDRAAAYTNRSIPVAASSAPSLRLSPARAREHRLPP
jgi:predicted acyl esterase